MRSLQIAVAVSLLACLPAGCGEVADPPPPADGPSFNFSNGPDNPGPIVMRSEVAFAVFYFDADRGVSAIHGVDIVAFCTSGAAFDLVDLQRIDVPEDANRISDLLQGDDMTTSVWPFTTFDCGLFTTVAPLATGVADLRLTDNDVLVFLNPDNKNSNAFGFRANGRLFDAAGNRETFNGHCNCVWDGNDINTLKCNDVINL